MEIGIAFLGSPRDAATLAAEAEQAGADAFLCGEAEHSAFGGAVAAATATEHLTVGTSVSLAFPRSPTVTAMEAWSLATLAPGRSLFGVGTQVRQVVTRRFSAPFDPPLGRMREYGEVVRRVLRACRTGEGDPFEGEHYQVSQLTFHNPPQPDVPEIPVHLGAVGPRMTALAAEAFDGCIGHGLGTPAYYTQTTRPLIGDLPLTGAVMASMAGDETEARRAARQTVAFYGTTPAYEPIFELEGLEELPPRLREAFRRGAVEEMVDMVDHDVAERFMLVGGPDEVAKGLRRFEGVLDRAVLGGIGIGATREQVLANNRGLIAACRRYRELA